MNLSREKVIISACLLGEYCRYDGKTKKVNEVVEAFKDYEIIPFCPEAPLFGTPRERINVVEINSEYRIMTEVSSVDVTTLLEDEIQSFFQANQNVDRIVLKSGSPSCGFKTTPILNEKKEVIKIGSGVAATMFQKYYQNILEDETSFLIG